MAEKEKDGRKAVWEAVEKPWAVALGMERKSIGKLLGWCSQQNLKEADCMLEGGLGDRDGEVKIVLLRNG